MVARRAPAPLPAAAHALGGLLGGLLAADERYALDVARHLVGWAALGVPGPITEHPDGSSQLELLGAPIPAAAWAAGVTNGLTDPAAAAALVPTDATTAFRLSVWVFPGHGEPGTGAPGPLPEPPVDWPAPPGATVRWVLTGELCCHLAPVPAQAPTGPTCWEPPLLLGAPARYWLGPAQRCFASALRPTVLVQLDQGLGPSGVPPAGPAARYRFQTLLAAAGGVPGRR